ncbi:MAG: hypothetical protein ACYDG3_10070 [Bacillati bacterium]
MTLRPIDAHGGETIGDMVFYPWPKTKAGKKALLELLGFKWDRFNALHVPDEKFKTQLGANVTCIQCHKLITLKNIGSLCKLNGAVVFTCKDFICQYSLGFSI